MATNGHSPYGQIGQSVTHWAKRPHLIEQFYYVTFWHSKVKPNTFIKYHTPVYDKKYTIKKHQYNGKNNDKHSKKNTTFNRMSTQYTTKIDQ